MSASDYRGWADCGPGSTVTTEDVKIMAPGIRMISTTFMTLSALDADKATVDMVVRNRVDGGPFSMPPTEVLQEIEIPAATSPATSGHRSEPFSNDDGTSGTAESAWMSLSEDAPAEAEGEETLQVAGQELRCRWVLRTLRVPASAIRIKTWYSDRIPGGIARIESRVEGQPEQGSTTTVVSFLKK